MRLALAVATAQVAVAPYTCENSALGVNGCDRSVGPAGPSEAEYNTWWNELNAWATRRKAQVIHMPHHSPAVRHFQPLTGSRAATKRFHQSD